MPSVRLTRMIAADPTSTALLLAAPSAMDLWPGLRRVGEVDGLVRAEADLPTTTVTVLVRALPPMRLPTSYVSRFTFTGSFASRATMPPTVGTLTLGYGPPDNDSGGPTTSATLEMSVDPADADAGTGELLGPLASQFLDNLARTAEERASAA